MDKIVGKVTSYVYHNAENGYSIAKVTSEANDKYTVVGYFPVLNEEITYEFQGEWVNHNQYGRQLKVTTFTKSSEQNESGVVSYLSSSFFHGIGPKTAEKIVELFGVDAIEKIIANKSILKEVGLNPIRIEKFYQQLLENQTNEFILVKLYGYNLSGKMSMKLLAKYQLKTLEVLEENPYQIIEDIEGIGFIKADEIARKLSIEPEDPRRIKAAIMYAIEYLAYQNGDIYLLEEVLNTYTKQVLGVDIDITNALLELINSNKIIREEDRYYLALSHFTEEMLAENIIGLAKEKESYQVDYIETLIQMIQTQKNITYTDMQKEAILTSIQAPISVITGGPGTGKTTIVDGLLEVYGHYHNLNFKDPFIGDRIALMAPTGRAAKRMKELLDFDAKTIHRHLGYGFDGAFSYDEFNKLPHDLIIIDEASMIDIFLAKRLFSAIKESAQVVIVGDVDQIPSVGPGQVLSDIIESGAVQVTRLREIHRQAKDSNIVTLAQKINRQDLQTDDLSSGNDLYLYRTQQNQIKEIIQKQVSGALKQGYDMIDDIQVLIPQYKGDLGIDAVNHYLQETFNPNKTKSMVYGEKVYYENDKVIQLVNDPERLIMNGDIGVIVRIDYNKDNEQYMVVRFDDNQVMYTKSDLDEISLAYAMSIHKAQGSEYKIVIMPMIKSYIHMLKKELLYTAITRAKQMLIILGDTNLLTYAANHLVDKRNTTLKERLIKYNERG